MKIHFETETQDNLETAYWFMLLMHYQWRILGTGPEGVPPPPSSFWIKKKISQKKGKPVGQAKKNQALPLPPGLDLLLIINSMIHASIMEGTKEA